MILVELVLVCLLHFLELKDLRINDRMDVGRFYGFIHLLELHSASNKDATYSANIHQAIKERGLILSLSSDKANDANDTIDLVIVSKDTW